MKILSFDPGGTTGYTECYIPGPHLMTVKPKQAKLSHKGIWTLLEETNPDLVICESFEFRRGGRAGLVLVSCEYIGVIKLYCQTYNVGLTMQNAATGKAHYKHKEKIMELGLWIPGKPHAMDSLRHVLQWFMFGSGYQYNHDSKITLA